MRRLRLILISMMLLPLWISYSDAFQRYKIGQGSSELHVIPNKYLTLAFVWGDSASIGESASSEDLEVWDIQKMRCLGTTKRPAGNLAQVAEFSENDSELVAVGEWSFYKVNVRTGKILERHNAHLGKMNVAGSRIIFDAKARLFGVWEGWHGEGAMALFGGYPEMEVWDWGKNRAVTSLEMKKGWHFWACFTNDGRYIVSGEEGKVHRTNLEDGSETVLELPEVKRVTSVPYMADFFRVSGDGLRICTLDQHAGKDSDIVGRLASYTFDGGKWEAEIQLSMPCIGMAISQDGGEVCLLCSDHLYVVDASNGKPLRDVPAEWCREK